MSTAEENDRQLGAFDGKLDAVEAEFAAGVDVSGHPEQPCTPIMAATMADHAGMLNVLLLQGADPNRLATAAVEPFQAGYSGGAITLDQRALHIAASNGEDETVRLLLKRAGADPNAVDNGGLTPLSQACRSKHAYMEVVRLLLEAGADAAFANKNGTIPMHVVALTGHTGLVDMLYAAAPATLNCCTPKGSTPLYLACLYGHESMVSKLLSLGAMQPIPLDDTTKCPLAVAVWKGFVGVMRILINEGGIAAVGGEMALAEALFSAIRLRHVIIFRLLLTVDGEEGRSEWANTYLEGGHLLHYGAAHCYPAAVSVLLKAGADEAARDLDGCTPRDVIGMAIEQNDKPPMDPGVEVAIRRMLQRGPSYRARSWVWPSDDDEADAGGDGNGDKATAAAAVPLSPPTVKTPPVAGVRTFRPNEKSSGKLFARLVGRYCAKD